MMKSWSRLCFLVLAFSSLSRGQEAATVSTSHNGSMSETSTDLSTLPPDNTENTPTPFPSPPHDSTRNATDQDLTPVTTTGDAESATESNNTHRDTEDIKSTPSAQTTASGSKDGSQTSAVYTATTSSPAKPETTGDKNSSSWGYVILVIIILVIIILCVILYFLRRVSRTYSFDLQRPVPANHHNEPTGTFEPVHLDDLDRPAPKDQETPDDLSPPPVANGTTPQPEEKAPNGETGSQEQPDANGLEASPGATSPPSLGDDVTCTAPSMINILFDGVGEEQQNENNNNPSVCSTDPFVEINLDDPAWCDQFLTSSEAPSSVLPFAPFSISSSSSSSS